jgi:hypothetical protein
VKATLSVFGSETFFYEFSKSIFIILQLSYFCDMPVVAVVSLDHVAVCTPEVSVFSNFLDCQRNTFILLNSCKFLYFLSLLSVAVFLNLCETAAR